MELRKLLIAGTTASGASTQSRVPGDCPQAGNIKWASIIRPGVTTPSFDNSKRLVDLVISAQAGGQISAATPPDATLAPPGRYMLFLIDSTGVPSVATWIHLAA